MVQFWQPRADLQGEGPSVFVAPRRARFPGFAGEVSETVHAASGAVIGTPLRSMVGTGGPSREYGRDEPPGISLAAAATSAGTGRLQ